MGEESVTSSKDYDIVVGMVKAMDVADMRDELFILDREISKHQSEIIELQAEVVSKTLWVDEIIKRLAQK